MLAVSILPSSLECSYCILTVNRKELQSGLRQYKDLNLEHPNWLVFPRCFLGDLKEKKINGIYKIKLINWPLSKPKESQQQTISCFKFLSLDNGESLSQIQTHKNLITGKFQNKDTNISRTFREKTSKCKLMERILEFTDSEVLQQ